MDGDGAAEFDGGTIRYARAALLPAAFFGQTMDFNINTAQPHHAGPSDT